jgi:hypothetical protein
MNTQEHDIAYWRRQYEENYEAAKCAPLNAFALTGRHDFITKKMENMSHAMSELVQLVGGKEAAILLEMMPREEQSCGEASTR